MIDAHVFYTLEVTVHIFHRQQLSQFWYDEETKKVLAKVCLKLILQRARSISTPNVKIALLCCPSLYKSVRNVHANGVVHIFEFDQRFAAYGDDYIHYDYKQMTKDADYMAKFIDYFDIIIADPPFLAEECIAAVAALINRIRKPDSSVILCSGDVVADWAKQYLQLTKCTFRPQHERNLANEFGTYANFDLDQLL